MDSRTWQPAARVAMGAMVAAACAIAGCGGGSEGGEQAADAMRSAQAAAGGTPTLPLRLKIDGTLLRDPHGQPIRLRGVNVDGLDAQDAASIRGQFNMNTIRLRITYSKDTRADTPSGLSDDYLRQIDAWVKAARDSGLWMVLEMRGSDDFTTHPDFYDTSKTGPCDPKVEFVRCPNFGYYRQTWRFLAERYRDTDYIAGYGLLAEPSAEKTGAPDPVATLVSFQKALMKSITQVDERTPFVIGPNYNYDTMEYRIDDYFIGGYAGRVIYAVNFLAPKEWINHGTWTLPCDPAAGCKPTYPFADPADGYGSLLAGVDSGKVPEKAFNDERVKDGNYQKTLSPGFIPWYLTWAIKFRDDHGVPLYVDQFGASTEALGQLDYEMDLLNYFEQHGLQWTRWSYNAAGPDGSGRTLLPPNYSAIEFYSQLAPRWNTP